MKKYFGLELNCKNRHIICFKNNFLEKPVRISGERGTDKRYVVAMYFQTTDDIEDDNIMVNQSNKQNLTKF